MTTTALMDESRLVAALTDVLRRKRQNLLDSDSALPATGVPDSAAPAPDWLNPIWQPLLDRLQPYAAHRQQGRCEPPSAELTAQVLALRHEYEGLQHTLTVWIAAIQLAMAKAARQQPPPVYGPASSMSSPQRQTLGRG
ncbi:MAG: hypothetical protein HIU89_11750 [Proteobacteria bacterium]|nr:hypothetical protein [Pseudomonadota bacterium]